jgi:hypothetical protein
VKNFHNVAIEAGGTENGEPNLRKQIHENYYAAVCGKFPLERGELAS